MTRRARTGKGRKGKNQKLSAWGASDRTSKAKKPSASQNKASKTKPKSRSQKTSKPKSKKFNDYCVEYHSAFYCNNGAIFFSLKELANALGTMQQEVFDYHVSKFKNDFYSWIHDVFKASKIAKDIQTAKTPLGLKRKLDKYL